MWAYSNNGVSYRNCGGPEQIEGDEVYFDHTPTAEELTAAFPDYPTAIVEYENTIAGYNRAAAYKEESDPLFFKWQRGEATEQEWLDKVNEIKLRYPKV